MGHKRPVLRPRYTAPGRSRTQIQFIHRTHRGNVGFLISTPVFYVHRTAHVTSFLGHTKSSGIKNTANSRARIQPRETVLYQNAVRGQRNVSWGDESRFHSYCTPTEVRNTCCYSLHTTVGIQRNKSTLKVRRYPVF